jgi:hypothetical protein
MRELSVEVLKGDVVRLGAIVTQARVLHPAGLRVHGSADVLTLGHVKALEDCGATSVFFLEPGETEESAARTLAGEMREPALVGLGDVLLADAVMPDGRRVLQAGGMVDGVSLEAVRSCRGPLAVLRGAFQEARGKARSYLSQCPGQPPRPPRPDTRLSAITAVKADAVKTLAVPRARVFVSIRDDFSRSLLANTVASEGHEVSEFRSSAEAAAALGGRPDVVIVDLAEVSALCASARAAPQLRSTAVLATASGARPLEYYKAMMAGANGSLPLPPRRDQALEAVHSALRAMGKSVRLKPAILAERRKELRGVGAVACRLTDKFLSKPLPVTTATVLDIGEGGLRIEYARPDWPEPWAYVAHSMHPKHFFFNYARANALGRELTVSLTAPGGKTLEMLASFMHLTANGPFETAGLQIRKSQGSVREHMTTVRGQNFGTLPPRRP